MFKDLNKYLNSLNNSRYFTGIMMLLMNIFSKFIVLKLSDTQQEFILNSIGRELLLFSIVFVATKDIVISLILSAVFIILTDFLFNEESAMCIIPEKYRKLNTLADSNKDGTVTDEELNEAIRILRKAKKEKIQKAQKKAYETFKNNL